MSKPVFDQPYGLRYKVDGKWEPAAVGAGFVEIKPDYVILLVGFAEHPEEIDRKRRSMPWHRKRPGSSTAMFRWTPAH